jgi:hypothetical protein
MKKKNKTKEQKKLNGKRLAAYAATTVAALAIASPVDAAIISGYADVTLSAMDSYFLDIDGNGNGVTFEHHSTDLGSTVWRGGLVFGSVVGGGAGFPDAKNFGSGELISFNQNQSFGENAALSDYYATSSSSFTNWRGNFLNTPGYLGVRIDSEPESGGIHWRYGWVHIDAVGPDATSFHIGAWAYEDDIPAERGFLDPDNFDNEYYLDDNGIFQFMDFIEGGRPHGASIMAGDTGPAPDTEPEPVPEPSSLALLALGAAGLAALRVRRKKIARETLHS